MKKILAFATTMLIALSAFAAGSLSANDCDLGPINGKKTVKGFTLVVQKAITIEDKSKEPIKNGDKAYSKRIKMGGANDYIEFEAKQGETVKVVATSGSKETPRAVVIANGAKKLYKADAPAWNASSPSYSNAEYVIPADGKYRVRGEGGGMYFFEVIVE